MAELNRELIGVGGKQNRICHGFREPRSIELLNLRVNIM